MIDRKTESNIKSVKTFLEIWGKFHSLYEDLLSRGIITEEDERKFLENKRMIADKYSLVRSGLDFQYAPHSRLTDPVNDILLFDNVRFVSERNLKKLGDDWRDSYVFLNNILERLQAKKRTIGALNPVGALIKKVLGARL